MINWKVILAYDGTSFHGWQIQPGLATIQGTLALAIRHVTGESVLPQGSGRTDTGVHALGQVASFQLAASIPEANLQRALNRALPPSIRILALEPVSALFHARHSAVGKTYEYRIFPSRGSLDLDPADPVPRSAICSPMLAPFVWDCPLALDLAALERAGRAVLGTHDFTSFAATDPDRSLRSLPSHAHAASPHAHPAAAPAHATNTRSIHQSQWHSRDGLLVYRISGNGFLHHMVRNLVGTFVDAACGRIAADSLPQILAARNRSAAGPTAPARGLFLVEVCYSEAGPTEIKSSEFADGSF